MEILNLGSHRIGVRFPEKGLRKVKNPALLLNDGELIGQLNLRTERAVLVGVFPNNRLSEYTPWPEPAIRPGTPDIGGQLGQYLRELNNEILPARSDEYALDTEKLAYGGYSLGGLAATLAGIMKERTGAKVRGIELSLLQRCAAHCASGTDIEEAFMSGKTAVEQMVAGQTDKMVGFECDRTNGYTCKAKLFDLSDVANFEKKFPAEWITPEGNNVTEDFIKYAMPLIQGETKLEKENGLPRFARLKKVFAK